MKKKLQKATILYEDRRWRILFLFLFTFLWQSLFLTSVTPLIYSDDGDSVFYKQMGLALLQGKQIYVDLFDHKGPVLYFIEALGTLFGNGRWGLFSLHVVNYSLTAFLWSEIVKPFVKGLNGFYPILLGVVLYICIRSAGNSSEDWCVLPISYALYLGVYAFIQPKERPIGWYHLLLLGVSAAAIFFIRANNAAAVLCTILFILFIRRKEFFRIVLFVALGFFLVIGIVVSFFYLSGGIEYVSEMVYGVLIFNLSYAGQIISTDSIFGTFNFLSLSVLAMLLFTVTMIKRRENLMLAGYVLGCFLLTIATMGHNSFAHYLIVLVPLYVLLSGIALSNSRIGWIVTIILIMGIMRFPAGTIHAIQANRAGFASFYEQTDKVISRIPETQRNKIWNYFTIEIGPSILHRNGIVQCNKMFLDFQLDFSEKLRKQYQNELLEKSPEWIIVNEHSNISPRDSVIINRKYIVDTEVQSDYLNTHVKFLRKRN